MKKLCFLSVLIMLTSLSEAYSVEKINNINYGTQSYGKETLNFIQANGSVILERTKVLGLVQVNGSFEADEADIDSLQINGQANLKNCLVRNGANINGSLTADNTQFQHELSVASQRIILRTCSVESLILREVTGYEGAQIIDLRSGTTVTGSIIVESGSGEVWLSSNSIVSGEITGAKVVKK